jgi:hypothetical protein
MQEPQQIQSGIGSLKDPRQNYFLGKLVKKATRGIKKVVKSPLGKLALLGAGAYGLGALGAAGKGKFLSQLAGGGMKNFGLSNIMSGAGKLFMGSDGGVFGGGGGLFGVKGAFDPKRAFLTAGAAATALPFFMGGDDEEEEVIDVMDPRYQVQRAKNYYSGAGDAGAGLDFMPQKKYVMQNFYAANGGRAGFNMGGGQFTSGGNISPGTDVKGNVRDDNPFTGGGGENNNPPPVIVGGGQGDNTIPDPVKYGYSFNFRDIFPGGKPFSTYGPIVDEETEDETSVTQNLAALITNQPEYMNKINQTKDIAAKIAADNNLANGGRAGYANGMLVEDEEEEYIRSGAGERRRMPQTFLNMGGGAGEAQAEQMLMMEYVKYKNKGGNLSFEQFVKAVLQSQQAPEGAGMEQPEAVAMAADGGLMTQVPGYGKEPGTNQFDYPSGGEEIRVGKQEGGIMETEVAEETMPMLDMGGKEKDYRETGGFVEMGRKERADDVPARLSKNEFVFTADAVRNAGGGDIDKGAEVMENLMNNLEQGGEISEESQGLEGAQAMYEQQQMLQSRMV